MLIVSANEENTVDDWKLVQQQCVTTTGWRSLFNSARYIWIILVILLCKGDFKTFLQYCNILCDLHYVYDGLLK